MKVFAMALYPRLRILEVPMKEWTVVLKTPDGLAFEIVKADYATWDDETGRLEFFSIKPGADMLKILSKIKADSAPTDEAKGFELLMKLLTAIPKMTVAGFAKDSVAGYFEGRSGKLKIEVRT